MLEMFESLKKFHFKSMTEQFRNWDEKQEDYKQNLAKFLGYKGDQETLVTFSISSKYLKYFG